mmetsp:Transcript_22999/g.46199  ORF Transcript_22999/g.46199 Transcript_22999/m.46199 type:complete len:715 (-) Transcript_22999:37-2181(-)
MALDRRTMIPRNSKPHGGSRRKEATKFLLSSSLCLIIGFILTEDRYLLRLPNHNTNNGEEPNSRHNIHIDTPPQTRRSLEASTADQPSDDQLRQAVIDAMMKTPGWKDEFKDMYIFAPRKHYERMSEEYAKDPTSMPLPYLSMLSQPTIESLQLPPEEEIIHYIRPYDTSKVIETLTRFDRQGFIFRYSGVADQFSAYILDSVKIAPSHFRHMHSVFQRFPKLLRADFPDRFSPGRPDFSVVLSTGDNPKIKCQCMSIPIGRGDSPAFSEKDVLTSIENGAEKCNRYDFSPIWNFASGFVHPETVPTSVTLMPWHEHLTCFGTFRLQGKVCDAFLEGPSDVHPTGQLYFGREFAEVDEEHAGLDGLGKEKLVRLVLGEDVGGAKETNRKLSLDDDSSSSKRVRVPIFDYLIPQVMWRGTNFSFLNCLKGGYRRYGFRFPPNLFTDKVRRSGRANDKIIENLRDEWKKLTPRWKAVTLTVEAERDMRKNGKSKSEEKEEEGGDDEDDDHHVTFADLPWIDAKFTNKQHSQVEEENAKRFAKLGVNVISEEHMDWTEASTYKYHTDFGGGGGTTWSGVQAKLALPGVLFHHETAAYDWFHEDLRPWVMYIPISNDLEDLRERYEWAEQHPDQARAISNAATAFMRYMGTMEYWERMYDRLFLKRLVPTLNAFRPMQPDIVVPKEDVDDGNEGGMSYDEVAFLELAKEMGYPLKKII